MRKTILTSKSAEAAKSDERPYRIHDAKVQGLHLRVQPSGIKSYCLIWSRNQTITLGRHPVMTLEGARRAAIAKLGQIVEHGAPESKTSIVTLGDFMRERYGPWVTAERKAGTQTLKNIDAQFSGLYAKALDKISAWDVEKIKAARLKDGTLPATVNRDLGRLKAALAKAVEWDLLPAHPLTKVKQAKGGGEGRIRFLSKDEEKRLRKALGAREEKFRAKRVSGSAWRTERGREALPAIYGYYDHLQPMTLLALNTGLRRGELTSITWEDINVAGKMLTIRAGYAKSGKARHVPLNSEAIGVLKILRKQHPEPGRVFNVESVKKSWTALMTVAGIVEFRFHDLRHTFASKLIMAGIDLNTVRELLGHADIRMTLRYAHLAPEHKAAAVEALIAR